MITGGAGFIGSHICDHMCAVFPNSEVVVLDKMTYAADFSYISDLVVSGRVNLIVGDICDFELCRQIVSGSDLVIHAAAESHVDRSFHSSILFTQTNALGTHTIMEACRVGKTPCIIHVSTDEVYGEVISGQCDETRTLNPTNPYSASKGAAEMIVNGYIHSFKLPVIIVRANNVFGTRQYPEKLIPRSIMSLITNTRIPLHGDGRNVRYYISVHDFVDALILLVRIGSVREIYNIGTEEYYTNRDVVRMICQQFNTDMESSVEFVNDRPFNDRRYAISWDKISKLGWSPQRRLLQEIPDLVLWYKNNAQQIIKRTDRH